MAVASAPRQEAFDQVLKDEFGDGDFLKELARAKEEEVEEEQTSLTMGQGQPGRSETLTQSAEPEPAVDTPRASTPRKRKKRKKKRKKKPQKPAPDDTTQLESVLHECNLERYSGALRDGGYGCEICAQADDEDWDDVNVNVVDGRRLKLAMRTRLGYAPEPGSAAQLAELERERRHPALLEEEPEQPRADVSVEHQQRGKVVEPELEPDEPDELDPTLEPEPELVPEPEPELVPEPEPDVDDSTDPPPSDYDQFVQLFCDGMKIKATNAAEYAKRLVADEFDLEIFESLSPAEMKAEFGFAGGDVKRVEKYRAKVEAAEAADAGD